MTEREPEQVQEQMKKASPPMEPAMPERQKDGSVDSSTADVTAGEEGRFLVDTVICLTREEIFTCLKAGSSRRAGRGRLVVQSVLLGLMAVYCFGGYFLSGGQSITSLMIGVAALIVLAALLLLPPLILRRSAEKEAAQEKCLRLRADEQALYFGEEPERYPYTECHAEAVENLLLLRFQGGVLVGIPRRLTGEEGFAFLRSRLLGDESTEPEKDAETGA